MHWEAGTGTMGVLSATLRIPVHCGTHCPAPTGHTGQCKTQSGQHRKQRRARARTAIPVHSLALTLVQYAAESALGWDG